ncbi:curli-like amyloid fiber formation chaperone CsgH [Erythrobacter sp.]|jgi:hypothetical protein|uniref:curli-like amyloid fiber formation chaperone CsgH n=1 Tax=Erythrobacter sp. TaxID=1042 RepID=UPI002EA0B697|nr:curli-like amyloid fiber formation chaperone CsgH [Erythrobacter sp.]
MSHGHTNKRSQWLAAIAAGAVMSGPAGAHGAQDGERAVSLGVEEMDGRVAIELIAHSPVAQALEYEIELIGASRSRHKGATSVAAGERHVLSTMKTNVSGTWCALVSVNEESGQSYTLSAGDCESD